MKKIVTGITLFLIGSLLPIHAMETDSPDAASLQTLLGKQPVDIRKHILGLVSPASVLKEKSIECTAIQRQDAVFAPSMIAQSGNNIIFETKRICLSYGHPITQIMEYSIKDSQLRVILTLDTPEENIVALAGQSSTCRAFITQSEQSPVTSRFIIAQCDQKEKYVVDCYQCLASQKVLSKGNFTCVAVSRNGKIACAGSSGGQLVIVTIKNGRVAHQMVLTAHAQASVRSVAISNDGTLIVTAASDGTAKVWLNDGTLHGELKGGHKGRINTLALGEDFQEIVTGSDDKTVIVWDLATCLSKKTVSFDYKVTSLSLSNDGRLLAIGFDAPIVSLWDMINYQKVNVIHTNLSNKSISTVSFSDDMRSLFVKLHGDSFSNIVHFCDIGIYDRTKKFLALLPLLFEKREKDKSRYPELRFYFMDKLMQAQQKGTKLVLDAKIVTDKKGKKQRGFLYQIYTHCFTEQERIQLEDIAIDQKKAIGTTKLKKLMNALSFKK